jgi:hypothetical protein
VTPDMVLSWLQRVANGAFRGSVRQPRRMIGALVVQGLLTLLAVLFICRAYGTETKLPVDAERKINLIRADFESKRTTLALRKATELSEQHQNDPQVHFALGVLLASQGQYKPAQLELEKADALQPGASRYRTVWDRPCCSTVNIPRRKSY